MQQYPPDPGIGIMNDGDNTNSEAVATYGQWTLYGKRN
jgi:hypothetical protein